MDERVVCDIQYIHIENSNNIYYRNFYGLPKKKAPTVGNILYQPLGSWRNIFHLITKERLFEKPIIEDIVECQKYKNNIRNN